MLWQAGCLVIDSFALTRRPRTATVIIQSHLFIPPTPDHHQSTPNHQSLIVSTWLRKLAKNRVIVNTSRALAKDLADENIPVRAYQIKSLARMNRSNGQYVKESYGT